MRDSIPALFGPVGDEGGGDDSSNISDRPATCQRACLDAMDNCFMLTDYLTARVYENYSAYVDNCNREESAVSV